MKRKIFYGLALTMLTLGTIGCCKKDLTITCTSEKENENGIELQNVSTYYFDKNQNVTSYSVITTQKFADKDNYETYKIAQEETVKNNTEKNMAYDLKSDDKEMTLEFTMTYKNLDELAAEATEEEKAQYKASAVLKTVESSGYTCKVEGMDRKDLK